jgi:hypothetical protein
MRHDISNGIALSRKSVFLQVEGRRDLFRRRSHSQEATHMKVLRAHDYLERGAPKLVDIIAKGTLYNWCYLRRIPFIKAGRSLRFDGEEVIRSMPRYPKSEESV